MNVILIHGRSQQGKDRIQLQRLWEESLARGFEGAGVTPASDVRYYFPYYGDLLFDESRKLAEVANDAVRERGEAAPVSAEELAFKQAILVEAAHSHGITDAQIADEARELVAERAWFNTAPVLAVLRLLDRLPNVAALSIELLTRDVWHYLTDRGLRLRVNSIVATTIPEEEPCIVVAHSLGTIIGYNLLMDRKMRTNVRAFVTLGSPLGIAAIVTRLPSDNPPRKAPEGVGGWFNARDPQDAVALAPIAPAMFSGTPAVTNFEGVVNRSDNQHGIADYLSDPTVARFIHEAMS